MTHRASKKLRVYLVDDHELVLKGLRMLLGEVEGFDVCGESLDAPHALAGIAITKPDVAIVDLHLKGDSGLALMERLRHDHPHLRLLAFTMHENPLLVEKVLSVGAAGYLLKLETPEKIVEAIRTVASGRRYVTPCVDRLLVEGRDELLWPLANGATPNGATQHIPPPSR